MFAISSILVGTLAQWDNRISTVKGFTDNDFSNSFNKRLAPKGNEDGKRDYRRRKTVCA
jgi:hypothetical protein